MESSTQSRPPSAGNPPTSKSMLAIIIVLLLLLVGCVFYLLNFRSSANARLSQLDRAQTELQQSLSRSGEPQTEQLISLARTVAELRSELDNTIPASIESQYQDLLSRLAELSSSAQPAAAKTVQAVLTGLSSGDISDFQTAAAAAAPVQSVDGQTGNVDLSSHYLAKDGQITVYKTTSETVNNSTDFQDDDELFFPVGANEKWQFDINAYAVGSTVADIKFEMTFPNDSTVMGAFFALPGSVGGIDNDWRFKDRLLVVPGEDRRTVVGGTLTVSAPALQAKGTVVTTQAGLVRLRWAQNVLTVADTTVNAGSWLTATKF